MYVYPLITVRTCRVMAIPERHLPSKPDLRRNSHVNSKAKRDRLLKKCREVFHVGLFIMDGVNPLGEYRH